MEQLQPEISQEVQKVTEIVLEMNGFRVNNNDEYVEANRRRQIVKSLKKEIEQRFSTPIQKAHEAHKSLTQWRSRELKKLDIPLAFYNRQVLDWENKQEEIRQARERELQEAARKEAEEKQLAEAALLEKEGKPQEADAVLEEPVIVAPVVVEKETPKLEKTQFRTTWVHAVENAKIVPDEYKIVDEVKLGKIVRAMGDSIKIPGVKIYQKKTII